MSVWAGCSDPPLLFTRFYFLSFTIEVYYLSTQLLCWWPHYGGPMGGPSEYAGAKTPAYSLFRWPLVFYPDKSLIRTVPLRLSRRSHHLSMSLFNALCDCITFSPMMVSSFRISLSLQLELLMLISLRCVVETTQRPPPTPQCLIAIEWK